jgi:hypothetical protein
MTSHAQTEPIVVTSMEFVHHFGKIQFGNLSLAACLTQVFMGLYHSQASQKLSQCRA